MKKNKKIIGLICGIAFTIMNTMPVFACTPQLQPPKLPNFSDFQWEPSEELKEQLNNAVDAYLEEKTLETPEIIESKYVHSQWIWSQNSLQVKWNEIENATSYEIKMTKADGTEETYTSEDTTLLVKNIDCPKQKVNGTWKSAKVQVRAIGTDGESSNWSEVSSISCNKIHW